jgi:hypothetical protein
MRRMWREGGLGVEDGEERGGRGGTHAGMGRGARRIGQSFMFKGNAGLFKANWDGGFMH